MSLYVHFKSQKPIFRTSLNVVWFLSVEFHSSVIGSEMEDLSNPSKKVFRQERFLKRSVWISVIEFPQKCTFHSSTSSETRFVLAYFSSLYWKGKEKHSSGPSPCFFFFYFICPFLSMLSKVIPGTCHIVRSWKEWSVVHIIPKFILQPPNKKKKPSLFIWEVKHKITQTFD